MDDRNDVGDIEVWAASLRCREIHRLGIACPPISHQRSSSLQRHSCRRQQLTCEDDQALGRWYDRGRLTRLVGLTFR